jgi:protein phosphatase
VTELRHAGISEQGPSRAHNEDRWCAHDDLGLYVVSDGMGGGPAGEVAAEIVVQALPAIIAAPPAGDPQDSGPDDAGQRLCLALRQLSAEVRQGGLAQRGLAGMGATAVVALVRDSTVLIGHIGDSRAYLWREGQLRRLTCDHSLAQALVDAGEITERESAGHPGRHQLTRHIGMDGEVQPDAQHLILRPADRLLLCTDGLTGAVDDGRMGSILGEHPEPEHACRTLADAAHDGGASDDVTALVVACRSLPS